MRGHSGRFLRGTLVEVDAVQELLRRDIPGLLRAILGRLGERLLDAATTTALRTLARSRRITLGTVFQAAWAVLLGQRSGRGDVAFGITVSGRPEELDGVEEICSWLEWHEEVEDMEQALWCLQSNANADCRRLAAAMLMNFADRDMVWWALMEGIRDSSEMVSGACSTALRGLAKKFARPWSANMTKTTNGCCRRKTN